MRTIQREARVAGFAYLALALTAPFSLIYVPGKLIVLGDAAATAQRIRDGEALFRLSILGHVVTITLFAIVTLALYRLLRRVNTTHAVLMVTLAVISVPLSFVLVVDHLAALQLFTGAPFLSAFDHAQLDSLGYLFLRIHSLGTNVAELFWGLWLLPFGLLVYRSGFLPRVLGVLLLLNSIGYVAQSVASLLAPPLSARVSQLVFPLLFGEVAIALWLAIAGARVKPAA